MRYCGIPPWDGRKVGPGWSACAPRASSARHVITSPPIPGEVGVRWRTARVGGADDARALASAIQIGTLVDRSPRTWCVRCGRGAEMPSVCAPPGVSGDTPNRAPAELPVRTRGRTSSRFGSADSRCELTLEVRSGRCCGIVWATVRGSRASGTPSSARIYPAHDSALDRPAPMGLASLPPAGPLYAGRVSEGRSRCRIGCSCPMPCPGFHALLTTGLQT